MHATPYVQLSVNDRSAWLAQIAVTHDRPAGLGQPGRARYFWKRLAAARRPDVEPAECHPEQPAVGDLGLCRACTWKLAYAERQARGGPPESAI